MMNDDIYELDIVLKMPLSYQKHVRSSLNNSIGNEVPRAFMMSTSRAHLTAEREESRLVVPNGELAEYLIKLERVTVKMREANLSSEAIGNTCPRSRNWRSCFTNVFTKVT
jgi:hypothetical protein